MRKGKVQLKRIEDKQNRQVTFSKRRSGLMKKAQELAVLCDADVALVVVSSRGRVYDFSSGDSLLNIIERYKIQVENEAFVCRRAMETKEGGSQNTMPNIGQQHVIQRIEMEERDKLNIVELTHLERQQDALPQTNSFSKAGPDRTSSSVAQSSERTRPLNTMLS